MQARILRGGRGVNTASFEGDALQAQNLIVNVQLVWPLCARFPRTNTQIIKNCRWHPQGMTDRLSPRYRGW